MKPLSPSPWRAVEHMSEVNFTHTVIDSEGERLARICSLMGAFGRQRDEASNAILMAASPELYDSLKSCFALLIEQGTTGPKVAEASRLLTRLRSALDDLE